MRSSAFGAAQFGAAANWRLCILASPAATSFALALRLCTNRALAGGIVLDFWTYQGVFNLLTKENIVLPVW